MSSPHQTLSQDQGRLHTDFHHYPLADLDPAKQEQQFKDSFVKKVGQLVEHNQQRPRWDPDYHLGLTLYQPPQLYQTKGDDASYSLTWRECLRSCGLYSRSPLAMDKMRMKQKLQTRYTHLFQDGAVPPLDSQKALLVWACEQRGKFNARNPDQQAEELNCNYEALMNNYGPNRTELKRKLNHIPGLI